MLFTASFVALYASLLVQEGAAAATGPGPAALSAALAGALPSATGATEVAADCTIPIPTNVWTDLPGALLPTVVPVPGDAEDGSYPDGAALPVPDDILGPVLRRDAATSDHHRDAKKVAHFPATAMYTWDDSDLNARHSAPLWTYTFPAVPQNTHTIVGSASAYDPYATPYYMGFNRDVSTDTDADARTGTDEETTRKPRPAPDAIALAIRTVTHVSNDINVALGKVTAALSLGDLGHLAAVGVQGFTQIVGDVTGAIAMLGHTPVISGGVVDTIVEALIGFVKVHQALLNTVIGKHSIFAQFALTAPFAAVLRLIEAGVDGFAFALIGVIPSKKAVIKKQIGSLDVTVKTSINVYSQLCFPSPSFPKTMPTCIKLGL